MQKGKFFCWLFLTYIIYFRLDPIFNGLDLTHDPTWIKKFDAFFYGSFLRFSSVIGGTELKTLDRSGSCLSPFRPVLVVVAGSWPLSWHSKRLSWVFTICREFSTFVVGYVDMALVVERFIVTRRTEVAELMQDLSRDLFCQRAEMMTWRRHFALQLLDLLWGLLCPRAILLTWSRHWRDNSWTCRGD